MNLRKVNSACGLFSAEIFIALWMLAAFLAPDWDIGVQCLSDLGVCGVPGAEISFNMGCACGGLFGVMFGIYIMSQGAYERYLGALIIIACFGLAGIGIINIGYEGAHYVTGMIYSGFSLICVMLSIILDYKKGDLDFAIMSSILLTFTFISVVTQIFEVYEPITVICQCIWIGTQSIKYMRKEDKLFDKPIKLPF